MKKKFLFVIVVLLAIIGGAFLVFKSTYESAISTPNSTDSTTVSLKIETGASLEQIAETLINSGVMSEQNKFYFDLYYRLNKLLPTVQAGTFKLPKNLTIVEISESLKKAGEPDIWVTIVEGLRKDEISKKLADSFATEEGAKFDKAEFDRLIDDKTFIDTLGLKITNGNLEGFLFPDKYLFPVDATAEEVIITMTNNFKKKVPANYTYDDIIIASFLEREGRNDQDRPMISDIIRSRLKEGWKLDIDATLAYPEKDWKVNINKSKNTPYNTYMHPGLTPTPICSPGLSSINASLNPKQNDYYFYLHEDNGTIHYGRTLYEHSQNIQKYLVK